jgi:hypothetical protein
MAHSAIHAVGAAGKKQCVEAKICPAHGTKDLWPIIGPVAIVHA